MNASTIDLQELKHQHDLQGFASAPGPFSAEEAEALKAHG